jgi:quercetin dioxygenase-like cupin family protein
MRAMRKFLSRPKLALVLTVCGITLGGITAYALTSVTLAKGRIAFLNLFNGPADVVMTKITIEPGESSAWHYHPGPVYAIVSKGTMTKEEGCGNVVVYSAGEAFVEEPQEVHRARNLGTEQVELYVTYVVPADSPVSVRVDGPRCGPPTSKEQCKDDGWMQFDYPCHFADQGDCVSFVDTGK